MSDEHTALAVVIVLVLLSLAGAIYYIKQVK